MPDSLFVTLDNTDTLSPWLIALLNAAAIIASAGMGFVAASRQQRAASRAQATVELHMRERDAIVHAMAWYRPIYDNYLHGWFAVATRLTSPTALPAASEWPELSIADLPEELRPFFDASLYEEFMGLLAFIRKTRRSVLLDRAPEKESRDKMLTDVNDIEKRLNVFQKKLQNALKRTYNG